MPVDQPRILSYVVALEAERDLAEAAANALDTALEAALQRVQALEAERQEHNDLEEYLRDRIKHLEEEVRHHQTKRLEDLRRARRLENRLAAYQVREEQLRDVLEEPLP